MMGDEILADIKIKKKSGIKIKRLNKSKIYSQKLKKNLIRMKQKVENSHENEEDSSIDYSLNQIANKSKILINKGVKTLNDCGRKATKDNIKILHGQIKKKMQTKSIKKKRNDIKTIINNTRKQRIKTASTKIKTTNLKNAKQMVKNTPKTTQRVMNNTKKVAKETTKGLKKAYQITKIMAKKTIATLKIGIKKTVTAIKAIIATAKALIAAIIAGRLDCSNNNCNSMFYCIDLQFCFGNFLFQ